MACDPEVLKRVPLFSLLDGDEASVLAAQVDMRSFTARQRIYKMGDPGGRGYVVVSGRVKVTTIDADGQEVIVDEPGPGNLFGLASMLEGSPHETSAEALEAAECIEVDRDDIRVLLEQKPSAGMDMLAVLGHHFHTAQHLVRVRSTRNPNEIIEEEATFGDRVADEVARFGGSWRFIILFLTTLIIYVIINQGMGHSAWDPYPFILLNLFLSMLAAVQAPVIMMSQNRQDAKDRVRGELDFDVNRRAASDIQGLAHKVNLLDEKIGDLEELLRAGGEPAGLPPAGSRT
jgi:uncharacterized membrane protein